MTIFKYNLLVLSRNKTANFMMVIFPIIIIFILGSALSSAMDSSGNTEPIKTGYVAGEHADGALFGYLKSEEMANLIELTELSGGEAAETFDEKGFTAVLFDSEAKAGDLRLYAKEGSDNNLKILYAILNSYSKIKAAYVLSVEDAAGRQDIGALTEISELDLSADTIKSTGLNNKAPDAIGYYAITMTVMIVIYAGMNTIDGVSSILLGDLGKRLSITTSGKAGRIAGVILSTTIMGMIQVAVCVVFSGLVYGVSWGNSLFDYVQVFGVYTAMVLFSTSFSILVLLLTGNIGATSGIVFGFAWISTFLCKGYSFAVMFGEAEKIFAWLPNSLAQNALFGIVYEGNDGAVLKCLITLGAAGIVFLAASVGLLRKKIA